MTPLAQLFAQWRSHDDERSLWGELERDAAVARFSAGDQAVAGLVRLAELATEPGAAAESVELIDLLAGAERGALGPGPDPLAALAAGWWDQTLFGYPAADDACSVLAATVRLTGAIDPQLRTWLLAFDGPGARHFADAVVNEFSSELWPEPDWQIRATTWARSEAAVNGITLIGGIHLPEDQLSVVLDRII